MVLAGAASTAWQSLSELTTGAIMDGKMMLQPDVPVSHQGPLRLASAVLSPLKQLPAATQSGYQVRANPAMLVPFCRLAGAWHGSAFACRP
jgi:hypothetical protein